MDALLASLPGADNPRKIGIDGFCQSNGSASMPSSMGHDDSGSDNDVHNLARGGDPLSHALRRGPASRVASSATSRKSSCRSERQSIASRGRPLKPHEADPFLAVVCTKTTGPAPVTPQSIPVISIDNEGATQGNRMTSPIPPTPSSKTIKSGSSCDSGTGSCANNQASSSSGAVSVQGREPKAPSNTPSMDPRVNQLVTSPFKQSRTQTEMSQYSSPSPNRALRENTMAAVSQANKILAQAKSPEQKKKQGRLLKGRLKPLYPVTVKGPTVEVCRGIISDTRSYSPSPCRVRAQRDYTLENILREYSFNRPEAVESLHRTSVASSESEFESRTVDAITMATEEEYDPIIEVHKVNSRENLRSGMADAGIQQDFSEEAIKPVTEDGTGLCPSQPPGMPRDQSSDTNNNFSFFTERPRTAQAVLTVGSLDKSNGRPRSTGHMVGSSKNVHFAETSAKFGNQNRRPEPAERGVEPFDVLPPETPYTLAPPSGNDLKHKSADCLTMEETDTVANSSAKRSRNVSRSSCRPGQLNGYSAPGGEDSDEERGDNNWGTSGAGRSASASKKSARQNSTGGAHYKSNASNIQGRQATSLTPASVAFERQPTRCRSVPLAKNKPKAVDFEAIYGRRKTVFSVRSLSNQHPTLERRNVVMSSGQFKAKPTICEKTQVFNFTTSSENSECRVQPTHMSAEYNMSPRISARTPTVNPGPESIGSFTFENLEDEINAVQYQIRNFFENKSGFDELDTYREHNLDDLVLGERNTLCHEENEDNSCNTVAILSDPDSDSDSEDDVAVISANFLDQDSDENAIGAEYSDILLTESAPFQNITHPRHSMKSVKSLSRTDDDAVREHHRDEDKNISYLSSLELRSDSGLGSDVWSESAPVSHTEELILDEDLRSELSEEDRRSFLEMMCESLPPLPQEDNEKAQCAKRDGDFGELKVVATTKELMKLRKEGSPTSLSAKPPPLCFRINARPPPGYLYYFTYSTDMNANRLGTYIQREVEDRFWGLLYGFTLSFNKKGVDVEAGGFPTIKVDHDGSVEGCLYLLTPTELERLDRCVGYPEHYEHAMFPVWMSNCRDPDNYGVAQYCVPALTYIAQDKWIERGSDLECGYSLGQCLKHADLLTPAYKEYLINMNKTVHPIRA